jgi:transcriptional regulator with XRE-family HTH domain
MGTFVADLDPRDRQARAALHTQLRARREILGFSQRKTAELIGVDASRVRRRERLGVDQAYTATVLRWAHALGLRLVMEPVGLPRPPARAVVDDLLAAIGSEMTPATAAAWQAASIMEDLMRTRTAARVTQRQLGDLFGTSEQAVALIETSGSSTTLVVLQRHARGIGRCAWLPEAHLSVHLEPDT